MIFEKHLKILEFPMQLFGCLSPSEFQAIAHHPNLAFEVQF